MAALASLFSTTFTNIDFELTRERIDGRRKTKCCGAYSFFNSYRGEICAVCLVRSHIFFFFFFFKAARREIKKRNRRGMIGETPRGKLASDRC